MNSFFDGIFLGNTIRDWAIALAIITGSATLARIVQSLVLVRIKRLAKRTATTIDDFIIGILQHSVMPFIYILCFYFGFQYLHTDPRVQRVLHTAILFISVFYIIRIISAIISYFFQRYTARRSTEQSEVKQARGILLIINVLLWIIGILFIIDNLGYNITTIVAGLGIGGIAIALAAQTVLGDLFSYLSIFFDKPFETGDFIIVGDKMGSVEYIGIKTTRIRALGGEQVIISNTDLTSSRIQNYKRMEQRRIVFTIGVVYDTAAEKLKKIPGIIKKIIESQTGVRFDRAHFTGFGDFSLRFETVYIILSADYNIYMDKQQTINLDILEAFEREKIGFAYPTQKLLLARENGSYEKKEEKESG